MGIITDILKEIPLSAVLREKLQKLEKKYSELETENTKLKEENQKLKSRLEEMTKTSELSENEIKILILLSSCEHKLTATQIAGVINLSLTKTKYYLERMWKKYVYSSDYYTDRPSEYYLLQKGREYLVENDLIE
jgi:predicted nuclease with TOPRIM domain